MNILRQPRPRHRFVLAYALILAPVAVVLCVVFPQQRAGVLGMLGLGIVATAVLANVVSRQLRRRLHRLREAAEAIGRGDTSRRIEHPPHDDFFKLSESLERMLNQLEQTLNEKEHLRKQLTRGEKLALIGELAATVAHEVNNPLDGLQNSTRIIRRNLDNAEQVRQLLDLMDAGLYRIEMIVRRLLVMARDEPVNPVPTRLEEIATDAASFVRPRLERYSVELVCDFPESALLARADREQMVQALINLMINAADSMPKGGTLTLRGRSGPSGETVRLEVIDTGTGIAPETLPHIFEPFCTTKARGGTGLGLSVVARIVEAHQGRIDVDSRVNEGTCFTIELPAAKPGAVLQAPIPPHATVARAAAASPGASTRTEKPA